MTQQQQQKNINNTLKFIASLLYINFIAYVCVCIQVRLL